MAPLTKSTLFSVIRLLFVVFLLAFLLHRIDTDHLLRLLKGVRLHYFSFVFVLLLMEALMRSYNWGLLLRCKGVRLPLRRLAYAYITGSFFGYFIPSSFGTDVSRFIALSRQTSIRMEDSAVSVVALNVVMLLSFCVTVCLSAAVMIFFTDTPLPFALISLASLSAVVVFLVLFRSRTWVKNRLKLPGKAGKLLAKFWTIVDAFAVFEQHLKLLAKVSANTFLIQLIAILNVYCISLAVGSQIHIIYFFLFMPMIALSRLVPISIANLGAEQGIFVFLFSLVGVPEAEIFLISVLLSTSAMLFIVLGGVLYLVRETIGLGRNPPPPTTP